MPSPPSAASGLPTPSFFGADRRERGFRRVVFLRFVFEGAARRLILESMHRALAKLEKE